MNILDFISRDRAQLVFCIGILVLGVKMAFSWWKSEEAYSKVSGLHRFLRSNQKDVDPIATKEDIAKYGRALLSSNLSNIVIVLVTGAIGLFAMVKDARELTATSSAAAELQEKLNQTKEDLTRAHSKISELEAALQIAHKAALSDPRNLQFVTFGSPDVFSVMATAHARAMYEPPFLHLSVQDAFIRGTSRLSGTTPAIEHVIGYRIGIAFRDSATDWRADRWTDLQPLNADVGVDSTVDLGEPQFNISIQEDSLRGAWLVLEVQLRGADGKQGKIYSNSEALQFP